MTLDNMIAMARQVLWRDANDDRTKPADLVQSHQWLLALEAAKAQGEPEQVWNVDLKGWPLNQTEHKRQQEAADAANSAQREEMNDDRYSELNDRGRNSTTGY